MPPGTGSPCVSALSSSGAVGGGERARRSVLIGRSLRSLAWKGERRKLGQSAVDLLASVVPVEAGFAWRGGGWRAIDGDGGYRAFFYDRRYDYRPR